MRRTFFNMRSELRHIKTLRYWSLENVLRQKYKQNAVQARTCATGLLFRSESNLICTRKASYTNLLSGSTQMLIVSMLY